jgi:glutamate carboxypeptidase
MRAFRVKHFQEASMIARSLRFLAPLILLFISTAPAPAQSGQIKALAAQNKQPLLDTLKELCNIESGSRDIEGIDRVAALVAQKLQALGGAVETIEPGADAYRMEDTPAKIGKIVRATFKGTGTKKILLLAHMDTVYQKGMLEKQPFRVEGERAYGLGIADDKQGVALVLHVVAMLKAANFDRYGTLTVLFNSDEEISSPGSRALITKLGKEHDVTLSAEPSNVRADAVTIRTSGIASAVLKVRGKASHAGAAPELGINALTELAHQIMQTKDLSDPATGLKMNWTTAVSGSTRNVIPALAIATADIRVEKIEDYDRIEKAIAEKIKNKLHEGSQIEFIFERRRPPLEATDVSRTLSRHAQEIYREIGRTLVVSETAGGGGTDAAFAGLETKGPVIESFGLQGFGYHSPDAEYVLVDSIEPRLYLLTRLIQDVASEKVK